MAIKLFNTVQARTEQKNTRMTNNFNRRSYHFDAKILDQM